VTGQDDALFPEPSGMAALLLQHAELAERVQFLENLLSGHAGGAVQPEETDPHQADLGKDDVYRPVPAPQWWRLEGDARAEAIARLAAWVDQVYRPSYPAFAARLPECWAEHAICLFTLDWLSELHAVLYLQKRRVPRDLAEQADWHERHLPAAAELMDAGTKFCPHVTTGARGEAQ
jgi:hypothetical protein